MGMSTSLEGDPAIITVRQRLSNLFSLDRLSHRVIGLYALSSVTGHFLKPRLSCLPCIVSRWTGPVTEGRYSQMSLFTR